MVQQFYLINRWNPNRYCHTDKANLGVMPIKWSTILRYDQGREPHHPIIKCHILWWWGVLHIESVAVDIIYNGSRLGWRRFAFSKTEIALDEIIENAVQELMIFSKKIDLQHAKNYARWDKCTGSLWGLGRGTRATFPLAGFFLILVSWLLSE